LAARQRLADVVLRLAAELEAHPGQGERAEALPRRAGERGPDRRAWQAGVAEAPRDQSRCPRPQRPLAVGHAGLERERAALAGVEPALDRRRQLVVERRLRGRGRVVAAPLPTPGAAR